MNFPNLLAERYTKAFHEYAFERERAAHRVRPYTPEEVRWFYGRVGATIVEEKVGGEIDVLARFGA